jgi:hypothetical protein
LSKNIEAGKTEAVEIRVAQGLLDRRMSGHAPEPGWRSVVANLSMANACSIKRSSPEPT